MSVVSVLHACHVGNEFLQRPENMVANVLNAVTKARLVQAENYVQTQQKEITKRKSAVSG